jgi:2-polyprenyl-3-methyl-5-hydroxy-6-metoxy-1,4-benzoquinol methylase
MTFSLNGFLYRVFIDPLLKGLRQSVTSLIHPGENVLDIACGTGALSMEMSAKAAYVTGIDLSEAMIITARNTAAKRKISNIVFEKTDATDLSRFNDNSYDAAVTSMSMHQFDRVVAVKVLTEMKRVARRIIIADYNCPMVPGAGATLARTIEFLAGGDHYSNFRIYMKHGGIKGLANEAGLKINGIKVRGSGVFVVAKC